MIDGNAANSFLNGTVYLLVLLFAFFSRANSDSYANYLIKLFKEDYISTFNNLMYNTLKKCFKCFRIPVESLGILEKPSKHFENLILYSELVGIRSLGLA